MCADIGSLTLMNPQKVVTPVKTGVHSSCNYLILLDSGFRRNDKKMHFLTFYEFIKTEIFTFKVKNFNDQIIF
jgi:hypothetical protein